MKRCAVVGCGAGMSYAKHAEIVATIESQNVAKIVYQEPKSKFAEKHNKNFFRGLNHSKK